MKKLLLLPIIFILSSCGNYLPVDQVMESWNGASADEIISAWGVPDDEKKIAGKRFLLWEDRQITTQSGVSNSFGSIDPINNTYSHTTISDPALTFEKTCKRYVELDDKNIIISWNVRGNSCSFYLDAMLMNPKKLQNIPQ